MTFRQLFEIDAGHREVIACLLTVVKFQTFPLPTREFVDRRARGNWNIYSEISDLLVELNYDFLNQPASIVNES